MVVEKIRELAEKRGIEIEEIREFDPRVLDIDVRTRWKCKFGCNYYGKRYSCPPNVPENYEEFIKSYSKAVAIIYRYEDFTKSKIEMQKALVEIENAIAFEYPFAFALFPGGCDLCEECGFEKNGKCVSPEKVRPSIAAMGIDVGDLGIELGVGRAVAVILIH